MKLYDSPRAPNPRRVRWFMAEKGIEDIEIVTLDLLGGQHRQRAYLAKAGVAQVPALELDDGTMITESVAVCRYLESRYPEPNLMGRDPLETSLIEMWTRRAELMVAVPLMKAVRLTHPALAVLEPPNPEVAKYHLAAGMEGLALLDARLAGREWLAADRLTIADIVGFVGLDFTRMIKLQLPDTLPNVARWAEAMRGRPAAKVAV